ncbi:hypothetical protein B0H10DRAFT_2209178 [Mycena sp. CBHHK59/15]|nr:hypothetical protein B0H10DRAFT_2209178 [Mycena sp. CBHHK59/15]
MAVDTSPLTGYYRCTDILYHYHQSLKNTLYLFTHSTGRDAILHPTHPLAADGAVGIQTYIGTFHDGQERLLFSSAQVDYLRYWMHAMRLTVDLLPLPYSDCMFAASSVRAAAPAVFADLGALSATSKKLGRMNMVLKDRPLLVARRAGFEHVRALWGAQRGVWCAVSFAAWDVDHTAVCDVGWSLVRWADGGEVRQHGHWVVKENQVYSKTVVEEGGQSEVVSMPALKRKLNELFAQHALVFLVSNDSKGDLRYLQSKALQVPLANLTTQLPDALPAVGTFVVDTAELFAALTGSDARSALPRLCTHLRLGARAGGARGVRNAGTDAEDTLDALRAMGGGGTLDEQRERRWPEQTEVEVRFRAWEDDPAYADFEGVVPPLTKPY